MAGMPPAPPPASRRVDPGWRAAAVAGLAALLAFALLTVAVLAPWAALIAADREVSTPAMRFADDAGLRGLLVAWQAASMPSCAHGALTVIAALAWWRHRQTRRVLLALAAAYLTWWLTPILKNAVDRPRPQVPDPLWGIGGYSFPSGHAANVTAAALALGIVLWPVMPASGRRWVAAGGGAVVVLTCADRVLLGVHYLTDVLAGVLLGAGIGCLALAGTRFHRITNREALPAGIPRAA